jgi:hypothetical protein
MKNIIRGLSIFLVFITAVSCGSIIKDSFNGGFEDVNYIDDSPEGWVSNLQNSINGYADLKVDKTISHSGKNSVTIHISKENPNKTITYYLVRRIDGLQESGIYQLEAWIKIKDIKTTPYFKIECWGNNKILGTVSTEKTHPLAGTKNWRPVTTIFMVPRGTDKTLLFANVRSMDNIGGKVWFDDIAINKIK